MNRLFVKIGVAFAVFFALLSAQALAVSTIEGSCYDIETKKPIAGANVYLEVAGVRYSTTTTDAGLFAIPVNVYKTVPASISGEYASYNAKTTGITLNPDEDIKLTIYMKKVVYDFTLTIYDYNTKKIIDPRKITFANISDNRLFDIRLDDNKLQIGFNSTKKDEGVMILRSDRYAPSAVKISRGSPNSLAVYLNPISHENFFGVIMDSDGNVLVDAKIILEQIGGDKTAPPKRYTTYTNYAGLYMLSNVIPGKYKCTISKNGYTTKLLGMLVQPDTVKEFNTELDNVQ